MHTQKNLWGMHTVPFYKALLSTNHLLILNLNFIYISCYLQLLDAKGKDSDTQIEETLINDLRICFKVCVCLWQSVRDKSIAFIFIWDGSDKCSRNILPA